MSLSLIYCIRKSRNGKWTVILFLVHHFFDFQFKWIVSYWNRVSKLKAIVPNAVKIEFVFFLLQSLEQSDNNCHRFQPHFLIPKSIKLNEPLNDPIDRTHIITMRFLAQESPWWVSKSQKYLSILKYFDKKEVCY